MMDDTVNTHYNNCKAQHDKGGHYEFNRSPGENSPSKISQESDQEHSNPSGNILDILFLTIVEIVIAILGTPLIDRINRGMDGKTGIEPVFYTVLNLRPGR